MPQAPALGREAIGNFVHALQAGVHDSCSSTTCLGGFRDSFGTLSHRGVLLELDVLLDDDTWATGEVDSQLHDTEMLLLFCESLIPKHPLSNRLLFPVIVERKNAAHVSSS